MWNWLCQMVKKKITLKALKSWVRMIIWSPILCTRLRRNWATPRASYTRQWLACFQVVPRVRDHFFFFPRNGQTIQKLACLYFNAWFSKYIQNRQTVWEQATINSYYPSTPNCIVFSDKNSFPCLNPNTPSVDCLSLHLQNKQATWSPPDWGLRRNTVITSKAITIPVTWKILEHIGSTHNFVILLNGSIMIILLKDTLSKLKKEDNCEWVSTVFGWRNSESFAS